MKILNVCCVLALFSPALSANVDALGVRSDYSDPTPVNQGVPYFNGVPHPELQNEMAYDNYDQDFVTEERASVDRTYSMEVLEESFFFANNSATLTDRQKTKLNDLARSLRNDRNAETVHITGFASATGNPEYNLKLSQKRAKVVADYLKARGVNVQVESRGLGELTTLREGDARRVDLTVETELYSE